MIILIWCPLALIHSWSNIMTRFSWIKTDSCMTRFHVLNYQVLGVFAAGTHPMWLIDRWHEDLLPIQSSCPSCDHSSSFAKQRCFGENKCLCDCSWFAFRYQFCFYLHGKPFQRNCLVVNAMDWFIGQLWKRGMWLSLASGLYCFCGFNGRCFRTDMATTFYILELGFLRP